MGVVAYLLHGRRLLTWGACGLLLAGMGAVLYVALPPGPRWSVTGPVRVLLTRGSPTLATLTVGDNGKRGGPVQVWDPATGNELASFLAEEPAFLAYARSDDDRYFVAVLAGAGPDAQRIAWVDLQERRAWHVDAPVGEFSAARFSRACRHLVVCLHKVGVPEAAYALADATSGRVLARWTIRCVPPPQNIAVFGDDRWVDSPENGQFTDDGRFFLVNRSDGKKAELHMVEAQSGKIVRVPGARLRAVVPDSRTLIVDRDGRTWNWDLTAMEWRTPLERQPLPADVLDFSMDGRWMASVPPNREAPVALLFFDLRTGREHWQFESTTAGSMRQQQFSPDGHYFVMPSTGHIALYDVQEKRKLRVRSMAAKVSRCLFSADARTLVIALDAQVEVLDVVTGQLRYTIDVPRSSRIDCSLSRTGRTLYVTAHALDLPEPGFVSQVFTQFRLRDVYLGPDWGIRRAYEFATGRELWRYDQVDAQAVWHGDDKAVLVRHRSDAATGSLIATTLECWDFPPRKPLGWIIGALACLGAALLLGRAGWRRLRRRIAPRPSRLARFHTRATSSQMR